MANFVRNVNGFSEFQLGGIQSWANEQKAVVLITPDFQVARVLRKSNNLNLLYWEYGEEPMISVSNELMGLDEFKEYLSTLSGWILPQTEESMNKLIAMISDLVGGMQWF